jgi:hypothetical protein
MPDGHIFAAVAELVESGHNVILASADARLRAAAADLPRLGLALDMREITSRKDFVILERQSARSAETLQLVEALRYEDVTAEVVRLVNEEYMNTASIGMFRDSVVPTDNHEARIISAHNPSNVQVGACRAAAGVAVIVPISFDVTLMIEFDLAEGAEVAPEPFTRWEHAAIAYGGVVARIEFDAWSPLVVGDGVNRQVLPALQLQLDYEPASARVLSLN